MMHDEVRSAHRRWLDSILRRQVIDPSRPDHGVCYSEATGLPDPGHFGAGALTAACGLLLGDADLDPETRRRYLTHALAALDYLERARNPSGLIDAVLVNPDSAPDTAFSMQMIAAVLLLARERGTADPMFEEWATRARRLLGDIAEPIALGGFHTPNHRWVVSSTLGLIARLVPEAAAPIEPTIRQYVAEGIDIDPDGFYLERSVAIYDAVTNRAWILMQLCGYVGDALTPVRKNLETNRYLFDSDLRADAGLSVRQDRGSRVVPLALIDGYLALGALDDDPGMVGTAAALWAAPDGTEGIDGLFWTHWALEYFGRELPESGVDDLPVDYWQPFPVRRAARFRRGDLTATVTCSPTFLSVHCGDVGIVGTQFFQAAHGVGAFSPDRFESGDRRVELGFRGHVGRRPGYEQPLGRPVAWDEWQETLAARELRPLDPLDTTVSVVFEADRVRLGVRTTGGSAMLAQLMMDVRAGTALENDGLALRLAEGQEVFLEGGSAVLRGVGQALRIEGGNRGHRVPSLRDSSAIPAGCARIIVPFVTPVSHELVITAVAT